MVCVRPINPHPTRPIVRFRFTELPQVLENHLFIGRDDISKINQRLSFLGRRNRAQGSVAQLLLFPALRRLIYRTLCWGLEVCQYLSPEKVRGLPKSPTDRPLPPIRCWANAATRLKKESRQARPWQIVLDPLRMLLYNRSHAIIETVQL